MTSKKALVVCCDGTGQSLGGRKSNIAKLYEILKLSKGTPTKTGCVRSFKYFKGIGVNNTFEQITASTLPARVQGIYMWLSRNYLPGFEIYLFGFSRGAFIIRSLVGLIHQCGLLQFNIEDEDDTLEQRAEDAMKKYMQNNLSKEKQFIFDSSDSHKVDAISFVGLFDTVSGLLHKYEDVHDYFIDHKDTFVQSSVHLMAADLSECFQNVSYHCKLNDRGVNKCKNIQSGSHQEYWLEGSHCDVGGGWNEDEYGPTLANIALKRMIEHCPNLNLVFPDQYRPCPKNYYPPTHSVYNYDDMQSLGDKVKWAAYCTLGKGIAIIPQTTCDGTTCPLTVSGKSTSTGDSSSGGGDDQPTSGGDKEDEPGQGGQSSAGSQSNNGGQQSSTSPSSSSIALSKLALFFVGSSISTECKNKIYDLAELSSVEEWKTGLNRFDPLDVSSLLSALYGVSIDEDSIDWDDFFASCVFFEGDVASLTDACQKLQLFLNMIIINTQKHFQWSTIKSIENDSHLLLKTMCIEAQKVNESEKVEDIREMVNLMSTSVIDGPKDEIQKVNSIAPATKTRTMSDATNSYMQRNVDDIDERDAGNPMLVTEYVNEMYHHFKNAEREFRVNPNYMVEQKGITEKMRAILIDWLNEVHLRFKMNPESLYLTTYILDRYCQFKLIHRSKLQLVGVASLFIASKIEETFSPELNDLVFITDKAYSRQDIQMMELEICSTLKYQLRVPTIHTFLCRYLKAGNADRTMVQLASYLTERSLQEYFLLRFPPSCIAASAVLVARNSLKRHPWSPTLLQYTEFREEDLLKCVKDMRRTYTDPSNQQHAVLRKYSSSKFGAVAKMPLSYPGSDNNESRVAIASKYLPIKKTEQQVDNKNTGKSQGGTDEVNKTSRIIQLGF